MEDNMDTDKELMDSLRDVLDGAHQQLKDEAAEHHKGVFGSLIEEFGRHDEYAHSLWVVIKGHPEEGENRVALFEPRDHADESLSPATVRPLATPDRHELLMEMLGDPRATTAFHKLLEPTGYIIRTTLSDGTLWHGWVDNDGLSISDADGFRRCDYSQDPPEPKSEEEGELIIALLKAYMMPVIGSKQHKHLYRAMLQEIAEDDEFMEALGIDRVALLSE